MNLKALIFDFKNFFLFLGQKKRLGLHFSLVAGLLLFLPTQGYYQTVQANWQSPKVAVSGFILPPPALYPQNITGVKAPSLSAQGLIILDLGSGVRILERNATAPFLPASTVKLMTALVALEAFTKEQVLTVPKIVDEGQDIKLVEGEKMSVESLLYGLLIASANDAAETLAVSYPGGKEAFIQRMNEKAKELFLKNTHFVNPTGIDEEKQYSSALDLTLLSRRALWHPLLAQIVATKEVTLTSIDGKITHRMTNINQLLGKVSGVQGIKTGWTEGAGECLITLTERENHKILIVLLGSKDRFGETEKLINWVFTNFSWELL